ncbi:MAG: hypothetical protein CMI54_00595 [Parcubacteria group bacterium]|nr:hypothetical protein [Parcubacteria group bacterium]
MVLVKIGEQNGDSEYEHFWVIEHTYLMDDQYPDKGILEEFFGELGDPYDSSENCWWIDERVVWMESVVDITPEELKTLRKFKIG